ncbi:MAG: glycosyltransferase family 2 protein [Herpetosiphonaceae bacterium]|nr:glycosyltransferase family 2 protein [Herpetosiphonaceae bacterium]
MKVVAIIPALNEAATIANVVQAIPRSVVHRIVVVDNGSADDTAGIARNAGADVVLEPRRGYGNACRAGTEAALDADIVVFLDGDGSFDPAQIGALVEPIIADRAELVLGSRELGGMARNAMPPHQRFGNRLVALLLRLLYGIHVTDVGPFRAIRRATLQALDMREPTYGWPTEMIVKVARRKLPIVEVPTSYGARLGGESKVGGTIRGSVLAGYHMLVLTLKHAWR